MDLFSEALKDAFEKMGYSCMVLDAGNMESELIRLKKQLGLEAGSDFSSQAAVITFNNMGYNLEQETGCNLWDRYQIPYHNILMDHPFHYAPALKAAPETTRLYCIDRNHVAYVKRFFQNIHQVDFLPHAGIQQENEQLVPLESRPIDVLYPGSLSKYKIELLIPDFGQFQDFDAGELCSEVLKELVTHPDRTTEEVLEAYFGELELPLSEQELGDYIAKFRFLDAYATSFFREQSVRLLVENGIHVMVLGDGWEQCQWANHENLTLGGKVLAHQVLPLMQQSKIVLNTMTWFKDGSHDRVFNGMLAGAAVVTDDSRYMGEQFENHKELEYFSLEEIQELPVLVEELLSDLPGTQKMADCGRMAAEKKHTWMNRAKELEKRF